MKSNDRNKVFGLLLLIGGICFLGEQLGYWDFTIFFPGWWTIFSILPAIFQMVEKGVRFGNVCLLAIGSYFLLDANGLIAFQFTCKTLAAIVCILIGIRLLFVPHEKEKRYTTNKKNCENIHANVTLGTRKMQASGIVHSLDVQCLCGSYEIDLSQADLRNMDTIQLQATLGTITVIVHTDINFVVKKDCVLGTCRIQDEPIGKYDVYVDVSCVLGTISLQKKKNMQFREGEFKEK